MPETQQLLLGLDVIEPKKNGRKKYYLLTELAVQLGIGEIRSRPYGCGKHAPYNIYFTDKIDWVIQTGIPLSKKSKKKTDKKQDQKSDDIDINDPANNKDSTNDAFDNMKDLWDDHHQSDNLTQDQKDWWLWHEYTKKHSQPVPYDAW